MRSEGRATGGLRKVLVKPAQQPKPPPCAVRCPVGTDIRGWVAPIAQRHRLGLTRKQAYRRAWSVLASFNPFPATLGRICPHPCQEACNRGSKDGAVEINAMERFLGDWALRRGLSLPRADGEARPERVGVVGAGPAGLSFAYQMRRRGCPVTVYERAEEPGGMLRYGIPSYRLPKGVLEAEVARLLATGVELRTGTAVGTDVSLEDLRRAHDLLFVAIGAQRARTLGIPGEAGPGCWSGVDFLARHNRGERVALGRKVAVVGGGNTAVDAARAARRSGAEVTLIYRRTRDEMPAIPTEIDDALEEGVTLEVLAAPVEVRRSQGRIREIVVQRMRLGETDDSGRRRPVPLDSGYRLPAASVIIACAQEPDWTGLGELLPQGGPPSLENGGRVRPDVWMGGDARRAGIAGEAIGHGYAAAEDCLAHLTGGPAGPRTTGPALGSEAIRLDAYASAGPLTVPRAPADAWRRDPDAELRLTVSEAAFLSEAERCLSCGECFGCRMCLMYCNAGAILPLNNPRPGAHHVLHAEQCEGCRKCVELCPCGFLDPIPAAGGPGAVS